MLFPASMMKARGLVKLGRLSREDLDLSSWWIRLSAKIAIYGIMDSVADMATDTKREMKLNTFGKTFSLLS